MPSTANTIDGFWEYRLQTRTFKQLLRFARNGEVNWGSRDRDGKVLLSSPWFALSYDLARDQPFLISANANPFPTGRKPDANVAFTSWPPHLLRDGWLWTSYPFGRVSVTTGRLETFPRFLDKPAGVNFAATCLEAVGKDQLLVGDHYGLYLVTLRPGEGRAKDPQERSR
ncbi:MAG: hypothetical protein JO112_08050 [Planctomycetes bacterium]|nr:hypothetical protein [Planctomycetota bacterium]